MWPTTKYSILRDTFRRINLQKRILGWHSYRFQEEDDYVEKAILFSLATRGGILDSLFMLAKPRDRWDPRERVIYYKRLLICPKTDAVLS